MLRIYSSQNLRSDWNRKWQDEQFVFIGIVYQTPTLEGFLHCCFWNAEKSFIMDVFIIIRLCLSYQDLQIHQKEMILLFPVIKKRCITGIETGPLAWLFWRSWLKKTAELNQWVERQITWVDPSELPAWLRTNGENKQPFLWLTKPISPTDRINKTTARVGD